MKITNWKKEYDELNEKYKNNLEICDGNHSEFFYLITGIIIGIIILLFILLFYVSPSMQLGESFANATCQNKGLTYQGIERTNDIINIKCINESNNIKMDGSKYRIIINNN